MVNSYLTALTFVFTNHLSLVFTQKKLMWTALVDEFKIV